MDKRREFSKPPCQYIDLPGARRSNRISLARIRRWRRCKGIGWPRSFRALRLLLIRAMTDGLERHRAQLATIDSDDVVVVILGLPLGALKFHHLEPASEGLGRAT